MLPALHDGELIISRAASGAMQREPADVDLLNVRAFDRMIDARGVCQQRTHRAAGFTPDSPLRAARGEGEFSCRRDCGSRGRARL
jgi:hypothetical protein